MSLAKRRAAARLLLEQRRNAKWKPNAGPQREFVEDLDTPDVLYGGARGGGKTLGLLLSWLWHANRWARDARGIIFRRTFTPELEEVIRKGQEVLVRELNWSYNGSKHEFTAPSGATLRLAHLENENDASQYAGHEYTFMGFDELGSWATPASIDLLWGSLRSAAGVKCIRRSTCMPGGPGHAWVRARYDPEHPGRELALPTVKDRPDLVIRARFIPAKLEDNPALDADSYETNLAAAGSDGLFQAWRHGRWDVIQGAYFECWNEETMTIDPGSVVIEPWHPRWISGDWGFADDCVILWHAIDEDGRVTTYRELKFNKTTPDQIAEAIGEANRGEKIAMFPFSPDAFAQRTSVRTIADEMGDVLRGFGIPRPIPADHDRIGGWSLLNQTLMSGHWRISRACPELIKSIPLLQRKDTNLEDVDDSPVDHAPDSARYGLKTYLRSRPGLEDRRRQFLAEKVPLTALPARELDATLAAMSEADLGAYMNRVARASSLAERKFGRHRRRPSRYARIGR